jgi:hypothetical protein
MKVRVLSGDGLINLGFGELIGEEDVNILRIVEKASGNMGIMSLPDGGVIDDDDLNQLRLLHPELEITRDKIISNPVIMLDSGEKIYGAQCWWEEVKEDNHV